MSIDYAHCRNITGTESMCYNPYTQRSLLQTINSRRDLALETLKEELATKAAQLFWSSKTPVDIILTTPSGQGPDGETRTDNLPQDIAINVFDQVLISDTGPVGSHTLITPAFATPSKPYFQFLDSYVAGGPNTTAGYRAVQYVKREGLSDKQLHVELEGRIEVANKTSTTTPREVCMAFYINGKQVYIPPADNAGKNSVLTVASMPLLNQIGIVNTLTVRLFLDPDDIVELRAWRGDNSGAQTLTLFLAKLNITSIP